MMKVRNFEVLERNEPDPYWDGVDLYRVNEKLTGWRNWVQKKCFRILDRLGARADQPNRVVTYRNPIDDSKGVLRDRIRKMVFPGRIWAGDAKSILMGPEMYAEIVGGPGMTEGWVSLNFESRQGMAGSGAKVFGLDVHVIQEMEGILVLPGVINADGRYSPEELEGMGVARGRFELYEYALAVAERKRA